MKRRPLARGLLIVALALAGCHQREAPAPGGQFVTLPSGRRVQTLGIRRIESPRGPPSLMLSYVSTAQGSGDTAAIMSEVDDIWPEFRKEVERAHLESAIVSANAAPSGSFFSTTWTFNVAYTRDGQGTWRRAGR